MELCADRLHSLPDLSFLHSMLKTRNVRPIDITFSCTIHVNTFDIDRVHGLYIGTAHERTFFTPVFDQNKEKKDMTIQYLRNEVKRLDLLISASHGCLQEQLNTLNETNKVLMADLHTVRKENIQLRKQLNEQVQQNQSMFDMSKQKEVFYNNEIRRLSLKLQEFINMDNPLCELPLPISLNIIDIENEFVKGPFLGTKGYGNGMYAGLSDHVVFFKPHQVTPEIAARLHERYKAYNKGQNDGDSDTFSPPERLLPQNLIDCLTDLSIE